MKKLLSAPLSRSLFINILTTFVLLLFLSPAFGQATRDSDHKADVNSRSSVRINPATLAMEFSLPLASYPGRGGNSQSVSFNYSSKVWTMKQTDYLGRLISGSGGYANPWLYTFITSVTPTYGERSMGGWTSSLSPISIIPEVESFTSSGEEVYRPEAEDSCSVMEDYWDYTNPMCPMGHHIIVRRCEPEIEGDEPVITNQEVCYLSPFETGPIGPSPSPTPPGGVPIPDWRVKRIRLQMPDGSSREFRKDDGAYDCNLVSCLADDGTYLSVDGTGLRLVVGTASNVPGQSTLFLPDGGKYFFETFPVAPTNQTFVDKHGNRTTFDATTKMWNDTLGRSISSGLPESFTQLGEMELELPSLGGQPSEHLQKWNLLKPTSCVIGNEPSCSEGALENPSEELANLGNDTCTDRIFDNPTTASRLFIAEPTRTERITINSYPQQTYRENTIKHRICGGMFNPIVLHEVTQPDGSKYRFRYNRYGEITKIIYPSGSYERFAYAQVASLTPLDGPYDQANRGVIARWVSEDGVTEVLQWSYQLDHLGGLRNKTIAPDGSRTEMIFMQSGYPKFGYENPMTGVLLDEKTYTKPLNPTNPDSGVLLTRVKNDYVTAPPRPGGRPEGIRDARLKRSVSITFEVGSTEALATLKRLEYDETGSSDPEFFSHLNVESQISYHFVSVPKGVAESSTLTWETIESWFSSEDMAAKTETDYVYDGAYKARGILGLATETRVLNPLDPGEVLAKSKVIYDNTLPNIPENYPYSSSPVQTYGTGNTMDCSSDPQNPRPCWQNPNGSGGAIDLSFRGLPTTTRNWVKETDSWTETHTRYDQFGNVVKAKDPIGNEATTEFSPAYRYAYPTKIIAPAPDPTNTTGTNETSTVETAYDFSTGLPTSVTDSFGQITTTTYDGMLRPRFVNPLVVSGSPTGPVTETIYGAPNANGLLYEPGPAGSQPYDQRFVKVKKQIDASNWDEATTRFDGLGRTVKTQAKDSQGDVSVETHYDNVGRVDRVTNPYRNGDTVYWSKTRYDAAGRAVESYAPTEIDNLAIAQSLGVTSFDISTLSTSTVNFVGTVVTTTDSSGRKGRSITNALGQLIRVDEPDKDTGQLGNIDAPIQPTSYKYDAYGKMVEVTQGAQKRWFKYDSLGRLLRVRQPEQEINQSLDMVDAFNTEGDWTAGFAYDILGNVVRATDANGVNVINEYDKASRVTKRCYTKPNVTLAADVDKCNEIPSTPPANDLRSTDTPTVEFFYDGKGLAQQQTPHNFAKGKLTKVTSSVSETQYQLFDNFGRLTQSSQITDGQTYMSGYQYNLSGALVQETYPSGRVVKNEFEPDGDLLAVKGKKAGASDFSLYASEFSYTAAGGISHMRLGNGKWETARFNNRLQLDELGLGYSVANAGVWKVNYAYGELQSNVIDVDATKNTGNIAKQTLTIPGATFVQNYRYDSLYRLREAVEPGSGSTPNWTQTFDYDRYGNRTTFTQTVGGVTTHNSTPAVSNGVNGTNRFTSTSFEYDKNGNLVGDIDPLTSQARDFLFNADNKQREVIVNGASVGSYFYDGEGKRVKKVVGNVTTVFVYSGGKLVAEYSTTAPPEIGHVSYTTTDHLGSPRVITNELGQVQSRRDFMPFGEDLNIGVGNRTSGQKYSSPGDQVRQKFTGYQKDNETKLDFAEARMYENRHGRFTAVDPLLASGKSVNPQTFNRFIYVGNNPIIVTDPSGLDWYSQYNRKTGRTHYKWFDGDPDDGWAAVDFGSLSNLHFRLDDAREGGKAVGTLYLNRYSSSPLTATEYNEFLNRPLYLGCAGMTNICMGNPAATFDRVRGWKTGAWNFLAQTVNLPVELPVFHTVGGSFSARQAFGVPLILDYAQYQNRAEAQSAFQTQAILTGASLARAGLSAASRFPRIGTKLDYVFGRATGDLHSVQRSTTMQQQLSRIGVFDNAAGRAHVARTFKDNFAATNGTLQTNGRIMREGLITGPNGALKFENVWDGNRLITTNLFGKGMPQRGPKLTAAELNKLGF